jgi:hypothetical protein
MPEQQNIGVNNLYAEKGSNVNSAGIIEQQNNYYGSNGDEKEDELACYSCGEIAAREESDAIGKIICKKCGEEFFIRTRFNENIISNLHVPKEKEEEYKNLIAKIGFELDTNNYIDALKTIDKGFDLFTRNPQILQIKAVCTYFATPAKNLKSIINNDIHALLRLSKQYDKTSATYEALISPIASKYHAFIKNKIRYIKSQGASIVSIYDWIQEFDKCYWMYETNVFLKAKINYLSGDNSYSFFELKNIEWNNQLDKKKVRQIPDTCDNKATLWDVSQSKIGILVEFEKAYEQILETEPMYKEPEPWVKYNEAYFPLYEAIERYNDDRKPIPKAPSLINEIITWVIAFFKQLFFLIQWKILFVGAIIILGIRYYQNNSSSNPLPSIQAVTGKEYALKTNGLYIRTLPIKTSMDLGQLFCDDKVQFTGQRKNKENQRFRETDYNLPWIEVRVTNCGKSPDLNGKQGWIHEGALQVKECQ